MIEALKNRFGKPKLLKQVYVRELIKIIALNVRTKDKIPLTKLFDNLESHLRVLESLGVTGEQTSEFLFPMVESALPEDILIAWQRSPNFGKDGSVLNPPTSELDFLMEFLKQEVESEQQRGLARAGYSPFYNKDKPQVKKNQSKVPTAANLFIGDSSSSLCIFCEKTHPSQDCNKAMEMSLKTKQECITTKRACNRCLKVHGKQRCHSWVKCTGCAKQHYHLLRPDSQRNKNLMTQSPSNNINAVAANFSQYKQVLLKTIMVRIKTRHGQKTVRLLFDDGSQQSYIKSSVAIGIKCLETGKYFERNTVFGGGKSSIEERIIYQVQIESLNGESKRKIELPDKEKITGSIAKIPEGPWMEELKSKGIYINDYESSGKDIDILIGADLIPLLVTDESITLKCGLRAVKTLFGWTIMGAIMAQNNIVLSHSLVLESEQLDEKNIQGLWDLELIGIRDPIEVKTQEEKNERAQLHF